MAVSRGEAIGAVGAFFVLCVAVFLKKPELLEPDDYAYRASIVALSQGHVLLTTVQYRALFVQLSAHGGGGIEQWVHLRSGKWISEKNPGYPFFAVVFQWLHALRLTPLFFGALASFGLFFGGRRWLGPWGGTFAVGLYCSSGAALVFAWRATMPSFSDTSLLAAGTAVLLGVLLAPDMAPRRRNVLGAVSFLALDAAVFIRYTDVVVLLVAVVMVTVLYHACSLTRVALLTWYGVVAAFAVFDLVVNRLLYGSPLRTGYASGLITFTPSAIGSNLERLPTRLIDSMPLTLLALVALGWIVYRLVDGRTTGDVRATREDGLVALGLGASWLGEWALYAMYTWTVTQPMNSVYPIHVIRFYLPALGPLALLSAWLLIRAPRWLAGTALALLVACGLWFYTSPNNFVVVRPVGYYVPVNGTGPAPPGGPGSPAPSPGTAGSS